MIKESKNIRRYKSFLSYPHIILALKLLIDYYYRCNDNSKKKKRTFTKNQ